MSETQPTIQVHQEREPSRPKPSPVRAAAAPAEPATPEIVTTITLKPGCKITIEYPS